MLAMKDAKGVVEGSIPGLAKAAGITLPECENGLQRLLSPDPYSRTKDNEGRRIAEVDGGWLILNHEKHRAPQHKISEARSKAGKKGAKKRWQNMAKQEELPVVNGKNSKASQTIASCRKNSDPDPDPDQEKKKRSAKADRDFDFFWNAYPRKVKKQKAKEAFIKARKKGALPPIDELVQIIEAQKAWPAWKDPQFIPHPTTWLNAGEWENERDGDLFSKPKRPLTPEEIEEERRMMEMEWK
jgi:hypothetical protein